MSEPVDRGVQQADVLGGHGDRLARDQRRWPGAGRVRHFQLGRSSWRCTSQAACFTSSPCIAGSWPASARRVAETSAGRGAGAGKGAGVRAARRSGGRTGRPGWQGRRRRCARRPRTAGSAAATRARVGDLAAQELHRLIGRALLHGALHRGAVGEGAEVMLEARRDIGAVGARRPRSPNEARATGGGGGAAGRVTMGGSGGGGWRSSPGPGRGRGGQVDQPQGLRAFSGFHLTTSPVLQWPSLYGACSGTVAANEG